MRIIDHQGTTIASLIVEMKPLFASALFVAAASMAHAGLVDPAKLKTSPDGAGTDVQSHLDSMFPGVSVDTDQIADELFKLCNPEVEISMNLEYQHAGYGHYAKLGYYTDLGNATPAITWLVGGVDSGLSGSYSGMLPNSVFGLALASGDAADGGTIYYSQTSKNSDGFNHMAALSLKPCTGDACDILTTWEDINGGGDQDYNDDAIRIKGMESVPEPTTMALLGMGAAAALRKRKAK